MSKEDFDIEKEAMLAIDKKDVKEPDMPVSENIKEAKFLELWATDDKVRLENRGLDITLIVALNPRSGALSYQQGIWVSDTKTRQRALEEWTTQNPLGYDLRAILFHFLRFAYRDDRKLMRRIDEIAEGGGHDDMIQDLMSLSLLGKNNTEPLVEINFDLTKLDEAATLSKSLSDLLALNNNGQEKPSPEKILRDRAFTHLKFAIDEIRLYGKAEFWREPDRLKGYSSDYFRN